MMKKVCADMLKDDVSKGIKTQKDLFRVFERLVTCFISVAEEQNKQSEEIYGNGVPGGLKLAVHDIQLNQASISDDISEIRDSLAKAEIIERRNEEEPSSFDVFVKWFSDKVLPAIVISLFMFVFNLLGFVFVVFTAISMGWLSLP